MDCLPTTHFEERAIKLTLADEMWKIKCYGGQDQNRTYRCMEYVDQRKSVYWNEKEDEVPSLLSVLVNVLSK